MSLLKSIKKFEFYFLLEVLTDIFIKTNILSVQLQTVCYDYANVRLLAEATIAQLKCLKPREFFDEKYELIMEKSNDLVLEPPKSPRVTRLPK